MVLLVLCSVFRLMTIRFGVLALLFVLRLDRCLRVVWLALRRRHSQARLMVLFIRVIRVLRI